MESLEEGKFSESHLLLLLRLIYAGANVKPLLKRGLQYSQIADLIDEALQKQFVEETDAGLKVTSLGLEKIKSGVKVGSSKEKGGWISPLDEYRIEKLWELYLLHT